MSLSGAPYEFGLVPRDSEAALWSFYPDSHHEPLMMASPAPLPEPEQVYGSIKQFIEQLAESTKIPISIGDAPEDECALIEMLNKLHEELPHGLKRIAMKKLGLREFELPAEDPSPDSGLWLDEWDLMLDDLYEMGFECKEMNVRAVQQAGGDLKQAVKHLRIQELQSCNK